MGRGKRKAKQWEEAKADKRKKKKKGRINLEKGPQRALNPECECKSEKKLSEAMKIICTH